MDFSSCVIWIDFYKSGHNYEIFVLSAIACLLILHSTDCDIELVTTNQQMPAGIDHKNILKPKMNPHKHKYT